MCAVLSRSRPALFFLDSDSARRAVLATYDRFPGLEASAVLDTNVRMRGTTKAVPMLCLRAPALKAPPYQVLRVAMPAESMQHSLAVYDELIEAFACCCRATRRGVVRVARLPAEWPALTQDAA